MLKTLVMIWMMGTVVLVAGTTAVRAQNDRVALRDKRITIQMANSSLNDVFARLTMKYDVAIGFEQSLLDRDHGDYRFETDVPYPSAESYPWDGSNSPVDYMPYPVVEDHLITVDFRNARLEDVLNGIVRQMKNYDWEINNDVVDIYPIRGRNPQFEKLLDIQIAKFSLPEGTRIFDIPRAVMLLPEFLKFLGQNNLGGDTSHFTSFQNRQLPAELSFSNLTLKELLNTITKVKRGAWIMRLGHDNFDSNTIGLLL